MNRSRLKPGEGVELLLACSERRERLRSAAGEDAPGLRELAAATVALDEPLPGGKLEEAQVLARARLADPDSNGCGRERPCRSISTSTRIRVVSQSAASGDLLISVETIVVISTFGSTDTLAGVPC